MLASLNEFIVSRMGETGPLLLAGGLGLMLIIVTVPFLLRKEPEPFDRLKQQTRAPDRTKERNPRDGDLRRASDRNDKLNKFAHFLEPQDLCCFSESHYYHLVVPVLSLRRSPYGTVCDYNKYATGSTTHDSRNCRPSSCDYRSIFCKTNAA